MANGCAGQWQGTLASRKGSLGLPGIYFGLVVTLLVFIKVENWGKSILAYCWQCGASLVKLLRFQIIAVGDGDSCVRHFENLSSR